MQIRNKLFGKKEGGKILRTHYNLSVIIGPNLRIYQSHPLPKLQQRIHGLEWSNEGYRRGLCGGQ